jgi:hypothetical protein
MKEKKLNLTIKKLREHLDLEQKELAMPARGDVWDFCEAVVVLERVHCFMGWTEFIYGVNDVLNLLHAVDAGWNPGFALKDDPPFVRLRARHVHRPRLDW